MIRPLAGILLVVACVGCSKKSNDDISADDRKPLKTGGKVASPPSENRKAAYREAVRNVGSIEVGSMAKLQMETDTSTTGVGPFVHLFCPSSDAPVPKTIPSAPVTTSDGDWESETWRCLKFVATEPVRCQYAYTSNGKTGADSGFVATATCDPDADGRLLKVRLEGRGDVTGDEKRVSLTFEGDEGVAEAMQQEKAATAKDMERAVVLLESLAATIDADKTDCPKMGKDLKAWATKNGAEMKALDAKTKQGGAMTEMQHAYGDRLEAATQKIMGVVLCSSNPDVASAMKEW